MLILITGSIIWVLDVGGGGYTIHTNPGRTLRLGLVSLYDMLPPYSTPPTFHLPNNTAYDFDWNAKYNLYQTYPLHLYYSVTTMLHK